MFESQHPQPHVKQRLRLQLYPGEPHGRDLIADPRDFVEFRTSSLDWIFDSSSSLASPRMDESEILGAEEAGFACRFLGVSLLMRCWAAVLRNEGFDRVGSVLLLVLLEPSAIGSGELETDHIARPLMVFVSPSDTRVFTEEFSFLEDAIPSGAEDDTREGGVSSIERIIPETTDFSLWFRGEG